MLDEHGALVRSVFGAKPDTLAEIQAELTRRGVVVRAASTIHRWLRRADLTRERMARPVCKRLVRSG